MTIQLPPDSTGKKLRTYPDSAGEHVQAVIVDDVDAPKLATLSAENVAAGASVDLDAADITAATVGKLVRVTVAASVPVKAEIKTVDGATVTTRDVVFTSDANPTLAWSTPHKAWITQAGGAGKRFRVTVTNLDTIDAADVYAAVYFYEGA